MNQQWMQNEFKDYKVKFTNGDEQCLVSVTCRKGITIDAISTRNILDKIKTVKFLMGEFNNV